MKWQGFTERKYCLNQFNKIKTMEQKFITVPFDVLKAKAIQNGELEGKIVTRDGRNARIICWDRNNETYPIVVLVPDEEDRIEDSLFFTENGTYYEEGETNDDLFLQIPEYLTFKDGDVLINRTKGYIFILDKNGTYKTSMYVGMFEDGFAIKFGGAANMNNIESYTFATEAEKQRLIEALQASDDPQAVDCLKKLGVEVKPKCEFTAGQPVIGVDGRGEWRYDFFSHYKPEKRNGEYVCTGRSYKHCLPYKGNEHLLGTTKSAEE